MRSNKRPPTTNEGLAIGSIVTVLGMIMVAIQPLYGIVATLLGIGTLVYYINRKRNEHAEAKRLAEAKEKVKKIKEEKMKKTIKQDAISPSLNIKASQNYQTSNYDEQNDRQYDNASGRQYEKKVFETPTYERNEVKTADEKTFAEHITQISHATPTVIQPVKSTFVPSQIFASNDFKDYFTEQGYVVSTPPFKTEVKYIVSKDYTDHAVFVCNEEVGEAKMHVLVSNLGSCVSGFLIHAEKLSVNTQHIADINNIKTIKASDIK